MAYTSKDKVYTPQDFDKQFFDLNKLRQHEMLLATESNGPFPTLAETVEEAQIQIETAIRNHAFEKLVSPDYGKPNLKGVLPDVAAEPKVSTIGWLSNSFFKPKTDTTKSAPAAEQSAESKNRPRRP